MLQIDDLLRKITDLERPSARVEGPRRIRSLQVREWKKRDFQPKGNILPI